MGSILFFDKIIIIIEYMNFSFNSFRYHTPPKGFNWFLWNFKCILQSMSSVIFSMCLYVLLFADKTFIWNFQHKKWSFFETAITKTHLNWSWSFFVFPWDNCPFEKSSIYVLANAKLFCWIICPRLGPGLHSRDNQVTFSVWIG